MALNNPPGVFQPLLVPKSFEIVVCRQFPFAVVLERQIPVGFDYAGANSRHIPRRHRVDNSLLQRDLPCAWSEWPPFQLRCRPYCHADLLFTRINHHTDVQAFHQGIDRLAIRKEVICIACCKEPLEQFAAPGSEVIDRRGLMVNLVALQHVDHGLALLVQLRSALLMCDDLPPKDSSQRWLLRERLGHLLFRSSGHRLGLITLLFKQSQLNFQGCRSVLLMGREKLANLISTQPREDVSNNCIHMKRGLVTHS